jgi:hypothetical protein
LKDVLVSLHKDVVVSMKDMSSSMSGMVLGDVYSCRGFTWMVSLPMWGEGGRCGRASLPPTLSYDL